MMFHQLGLVLNREAGRGEAPSKTPLPPRLRKERRIKGVRLINKKQRGFTLIELLIAIAITALITGVITTAIFQTFTVSARTSSHMTAVRQVQNAGHWISQDAQMAQEVEPTPAPDPDGFPLTLTWTDWDDNEKHEVIYTLENMIGGAKQLERQHLTYDGSGNEIGDETSIVARYIDSTYTNCQVTAGVLMVTVTAAVGDYPETVSETRVYEITPRPNI